jgi:hypothetical protein
MRELDVQENSGTYAVHFDKVHKDADGLHITNIVYIEGYIFVMVGGCPCIGGEMEHPIVCLVQW